MKLLIVTDLEGVSGIVDWDPEEKSTPEQRAYQDFLMTNEVNGAVEGALQGGAKEVWVSESHPIDIRQLHPDARLLKMSPRRLTPRQLGMTRGRWDAAAFVGNHAMAGDRGTLSHTQNPATAAIRLNGRLVGEFGIQAAIAGDFGMPMIFVSGDDVACAQAREVVPGIETAVVKECAGRFAAWCLSPKRAHDLIAERMAVAARRWKEITPFVIPGPVTLREELISGYVREVTAPTAWEAFEIRCRPA